MSALAYRFLPLADDGTPVEGARYVLIRDERLDVGEQVSFAVLGYEIWEIVDFEPTSGPLVGAYDVDGREIPLAGTVICRGVR